MYSGNAQTVVAEKAKEPTVVFNLLESFKDQNERLFQTIGYIENIGDRLKNTNFPKAMEMKAESNPSDGFLADIGEQLDRFRNLNNRLYEFSQKLDSLI